MSAVSLSCTGISKTFMQAVNPSSMLQDRILRWRKHREYWTLKAIDNLSLSVSEGEWVGIYGANGSGKTSLLRILAGLMPPDEGEVRSSGRMSCFFELGVGFHPERSATENIYLHGLLHGHPPAVIRAQTEHIIRFAGVESHRDLPIKCYSTGMSMRLAFAAASITDADIYLFDEILAVGDARFREICKEHLLGLKRKGKTALIVNHGIADLREFCDRILYLEKGAIIREEIVDRQMA